METPLNSILAPADQLRDLLFTPRLIYFCAFFAYYGLKNGISLTHGGLRKGTIAKIYGVLYLLVCLFSLWSFPSDIQKVMAINSSDMRNALFFIEPFQLGFVSIGISAFIFIFTEWLIRYSRKKVSAKSRKLHRIQDRKKFLNWMIAFPLVTGIQTLIGLPYWVNIGIFVFFTYFAPFTSPKELMKAMRLPDEEHQGVKSVPSTENVG